MTPEIAAKIHEIRMMILRGDVDEATKLKLVAEGVAMYRDARGKVMAATQAKATAPKRTKKATSADLLNSIIGSNSTGEQP